MGAPVATFVGSWGEGPAEWRQTSTQTRPRGSLGIPFAQLSPRSWARVGSSGEAAYAHPG
eukprot:826114-Pyramimonas_sp.AAC.1